MGFFFSWKWAKCLFLFLNSVFLLLVNLPETVLHYFSPPQDPQTQFVSFFFLPDFSQFTVSLFLHTNPLKQTPGKVKSVFPQVSSSNRTFYWVRREGKQTILVNDQTKVWGDQTTLFSGKVCRSREQLDMCRVNLVCKVIEKNIHWFLRTLYYQPKVEEPLGI